MGMSIMRCRFVLRTLYGLTLGLSALASIPAHAADVAAGKEKAELCVGCHGDGGISQNEKMQPIVEQINTDDIRNLGAYFASLAPPKASKPDDNPDLSRKGAEAATGRRCASCHTDTYAGTKAVARVAGQ